MPEELELTTPTFIRRISALEALQGAVISPQIRVEMMVAEEYEVFILEWVIGYLAQKYVKTRSFAGAGDKGRDVVGYYADSNIDIYQCKHYSEKLGLATLLSELGKLCYFTFNKEFAIPLNYFIVAPKGCSPTLLDFIDFPSKFNQHLLDNWSTNCEKKITKKHSVLLTDEFRKYIEKFDFSIVKDLASHEIIDQHKQTAYHVLRFGGGLKKYREVIPAPDKGIQPREQNYTQMLFEVYEQELKEKVTKPEDLTDKGKYFEHFNSQRNSFYSAESLEKFSRENFPDSEPALFSDLLDDACSVISTTLEINSTQSGYNRILLSSQEIKRQNFTNSPLAMEIKPLDKDGLYNHLANENRVKWILK